MMKLPQFELCWGVVLCCYYCGQWLWTGHRAKEASSTVHPSL